MKTKNITWRHVSGRSVEPSEVEGYNVGHYWDWSGKFLGPDKHGIYPEYEGEIDIELSDGSASDTVTVEVESMDGIQSAAEEAARDWVDGGDWGSDGASVSVRWSVTIDGEEMSGCVDVEVEADHGSLIRDVGHEDSCGDDPDDHDWTSEGEGGCDSNPGVWSLGGTTVRITSHCRTCGLRRCVTRHGSQRNPGQVDTTTYSRPECR